MKKQTNKHAFVSEVEKAIKIPFFVSGCIYAVNLGILTQEPLAAIKEREVFCTSILALFLVG